MYLSYNFGNFKTLFEGSNDFITEIMIPLDNIVIIGTLIKY